MNANTGSNENMKSLLLGFVDIINETRSKLPAGCISESNNGGFNARSVKDVNNLSNDVDASDGFIKDGLMVRMADQRKATKEDKFHGYKVMFELNGIYNGVYVIFTRTEMEYKIYLNRDMWKVESHEVEYRAIDPEGESFKRSYKVPMTDDPITGEFRCCDRRNTLENKVGLAMKSKLAADYDAYLGYAKFDEESSKFVYPTEAI